MVNTIPVILAAPFPAARGANSRDATSRTRRRLAGLTRRPDNYHPAAAGQVRHPKGRRQAEDGAAVDTPGTRRHPGVFRWCPASLATHGIACPCRATSAALPPAGLQPGQSLAVAETAAANQELVANQPAAPADEDRRSAGQARPVLLAVVGRWASEPQAVRPDARTACGATCAGRLAPTARTSQRMRVTEGRRGRGVAKRPFAVVGTAQSGNIRRTEQQRKGYRGCSSPKPGAPRPWIGYRARARTVKKEILVNRVRFP